MAWIATICARIVESESSIRCVAVYRRCCYAVKSSRDRIGLLSRAGQTSSGNDGEKVTQENFKISGVSELALGVADLERAERFYAGTLGLPVVERWRDAVWVMAGNRTRIGLWLVTVAPIAGERGGSHVHFAVHTSEVDLDSLIGRLEAEGHTVHLERFTDGRGRAAYVSDPDGNVVEFWTWDVSQYFDELPTGDPDPRST